MIFSPGRTLPAWLAVSGLCVAAAQAGVTRIPGSSTAQTGLSVHTVDDVTSDGIPEIVIPQNITNSVMIFDGSTFTEIREVTSPGAQSGSFWLNGSVEIPDFGGGPGSDILLFAPGEDGGASGSGQAHIIDPSDGSILQTFASPNVTPVGFFGEAGGSLGDLNSDTVQDFVIGAPNEGASDDGRVYVISGVDGSQIALISSPNPVSNGDFGAQVQVLGDLNGDTVPEFAVGARGETLGSLTDAGRGYVYDGATQALLYPAFESPNAEQDGAFGLPARMPDLTGDTVPEFAFGAPSEDVPGQVGGGRLYIYSGATGALLDTLSLPAGNRFFGSDADPLIDLNGDTIAEFAVRQGDTSDSSLRGRVNVFDGASRTLLTTVENPVFSGDSIFGYVWPLADISGDGLNDVAIVDFDYSFDLNATFIYKSQPDLGGQPAASNFQKWWPGGGQSPETGLTLRNDGMMPLTLSGASLSGTDAGEFAITAAPAAGTYQWGESASMSLAFDPSSDGDKTASLDFSTDDADGAESTALAGEGYTIPVSTIGETLYISYGSVVAEVDVATGDRRIVIDIAPTNLPPFPPPPPPPTINGVLIEDANNLIMVTAGSVSRVDRTTGTSTVISSDGGAGGGDNFNASLRGVARLNANEVVVGLSFTGAAIVDLTTGNRTVVASGSVGSGWDLFTPFEVGADLSGNPLIGDATGAQIYRVNLPSLERSYLNGDVPPFPGAPSTLPGLLISPYNIENLSNGDFLIAQQAGVVVHVDGTTGLSQPWNSPTGGFSFSGSYPPLGSGESFDAADTVGISAGNFAYVYDAANGRVIEFNPNSNVRTLISEDGVRGSGPDISYTNPFFGDDQFHMAVESSSGSDVNDWTRY